MTKKEIKNNFIDIFFYFFVFLMFEGIVVSLLNRLIGKYVDNLDTKQLSISVWKGLNLVYLLYIDILLSNFKFNIIY